MTISYPLTYPSVVAPSSILIRPRNVVGVSASPFTGEQQVFRHQGQWWELELTVGPFDHDSGAVFKAWLTSLMGRFGTFMLGDPQRATARGAATGTPLVSGGSQTGNTLATDGWTAGVTGILKAGDHIQLGNNLHEVLQDVNSNGSGEATLDIWPRLRSSPADNAGITVSSPKGIWRLAANDTGYELQDMRVMPVTIQANEAV